LSGAHDASRLSLPAASDGLRIGLVGGSFNPPHAAHLAISQFAIKRLRLDRVWWLVSPGNPLKDNHGLPPLDQRIDAAQKIARDPRIAVSGIEAVIGTQYTEDTLRWLTARLPRAKFVWIMGADNLAQFHRWRNWRHIADLMPIAVVDRGEAGLRALASPAAQALARSRIDTDDAGSLAERRPPAWVFLHGLKLRLSSTQLRGGVL
jgi:nicotinate-nucleotide adenylyltransferase